jgi:hypothetical protein
MAAPAVAHHGQTRRRNVDQWVIPIIVAAWVIVVLCGYLVYGLA